MKTRTEILETLTQGKKTLAKPFKVKRMALFGSWARGDNKPDSDVDVLVEVDPSIGLEFVTLADKLEEMVGQPVDLVSHRALKPQFREIIESELIDV
jgi:predicted nucleotidyltransferase